MSAPDPNQPARPWLPKVELDDAQAGHFIESRFPELAPVRLAPLGTGWDNVAYIANDTWVFRFPRRDLGARLLARETELLPHLAPHLPLPVPVPVYVGAPAGEYPYSFAGYRMLAGRTACSVPAVDAGRPGNARALGHFLAALHQLRTPAPEPRRWGDDIDRAGMTRRLLDLLEERVPYLAKKLPELPWPALGAMARELAATPPWAGPPCWVHGDLYARHLLMDDRGDLCGVIDWGDVHAGDPALDLSIVPSLLPPGSRDEFYGAYGPVDPDTRARARFCALHYGVALTYYGHEVGDAALIATGRTALDHSLPDLL